jgi:hypothetical protein
MTRLNNLCVLKRLVLEHVKQLFSCFNRKEANVTNRLADIASIAVIPNFVKTARHRPHGLHEALKVLI